jgi:hypothetical protein
LWTESQIKLYLLIKSDLKCSCGNEVRYLDLTYFQNSRKEVKRFLVAVQRTYAIFKSGVILNCVISYCLGDLDLFRGPDESVSRVKSDPRAVGWRPLV